MMPTTLLLESSGAPASDLDEIKVLDNAGGEVPDGEHGRTGDARSVHDSRVLQRTGAQRDRRSLPTVSTGWATSCVSVAATCTPKAVARTSSTGAARRSAARRSRTSFFGLAQVQSGQPRRDAGSRVRREGLRLRRASPRVGADVRRPDRVTCGRRGSRRSSCRSVSRSWPHSR